MDHRPTADLTENNLLTIDPVCGAEISAVNAVINKIYREYDGKQFYFCSWACLQVFQKNPERFLASGPIVQDVKFCELCSKEILEDDALTGFKIREETYNCCSNCTREDVPESVPAASGSPKTAEEQLEEMNRCGLLDFLKDSVAARASDLFLTLGEQPTMKVFGEFRRLDSPPLTAPMISRIIEAVLPASKLAVYQNGKEVDLGLDVPDCSRFRLNLFRHQTGETIVIRPIPHSIPSLEELSLPPVFQDLVRLRRGLILITGPAGSGKSTTLASFINHINRKEERHIITIEDPVEYFIPNQRSLVHQREVGHHTASFSDGLRNSLRENPDVIVVGELRDLESVSLAIRAAETGHLVLGTLHSGSTVQSITRLLDIFEAGRQPLIRVQLAQSLQAICSQRLYKRQDKPGMIVATEMLIATLAIRNIIREHRIQEIRGFIETGMREQMHTFGQSVEQLVGKKLIDPVYLKDTGEENPVPEIPMPDLSRTR